MHTVRPGETGRDRDAAYFQIDFKYLRNIFEIMFKKYRGRKSWGRIDFTPGGLKLAKYLFENQVQAFSLITKAFPPPLRGLAKCPMLVS